MCLKGGACPRLDGRSSGRRRFLHSSRFHSPAKEKQENEGKEFKEVQDQDSKGSKSSKKSKSSRDFPMLISLGNVRPEGTTPGKGSMIYVSNFFFGGISSVDVSTGKVKEVVPDFEFYSRGGLGLSYYKGALFTGGCGPKGGFSEAAAVYVYDAKTGEEIAACQPLTSTADSCMNEVTIQDGKAYITDSGFAELMVLDANAALDGDCVVSSIELPDELNVPGGDNWGANGVVPYGDGLIIVTETAGEAYFLDLMDESVDKIIADGAIEFADGVIVLKDKMYVTQNFHNQISVWALSGGMDGEPVMAIKEGELTSPYLDTPATTAEYGGHLYSVNARFATLDFPEPGEENPDDFDEEFHMVAIRNVFDPAYCKA